MSKPKGKTDTIAPPAETIKTEQEVIKGTGQFLLLDNSQYDGEWKEVNGVKYRDGSGVMISGPEKYTGQWENDNMNGIGEYYFSSGAIYKGNFKNNMFEGNGTYKYPDNATYVGQWHNNKMHGKGVYTDAEGAVFEGDFFNGLYNSGRSYISLRNKAS